MTVAACSIDLEASFICNELYHTSIQYSFSRVLEQVFCKYLSAVQHSGLILPRFDRPSPGISSYSLM